MITVTPIYFWGQNEAVLYDVLELIVTRKQKTFKAFFSQPWLSRDLRSLRNRRNKAYKKFRRNSVDEADSLTLSILFKESSAQVYKDYVISTGTEKLFEVLLEVWRFQTQDSRVSFQYIWWYPIFVRPSVLHLMIVLRPKVYEKL